MQKIFEAEAKRSGLHMTIVGKDEAGGVVKVSGVTLIKFGAVADESTGLRHPTVATAESGLEYELV